MSDIEDALDLFQEPAEYYPPEKEATFASHKLSTGEEVTVRLVGHNPLWGHLLWNAGRTVSDFLEQHAEERIKDRTVLELGAGSGLPSLVSAIKGAKHVVVTDYPDPDLVANLQWNIDHCKLLPASKAINAEGYLWGASVEKLLEYLPPDERDNGFDLLILADLLFNHSEHGKLVKTVLDTMKTRDARALVFFTPYRPWLLEKDLAFFDLAKQEGLHVEKIMEKVMDKVMFEEDRGDELLRRTVYGYELKLP